MSEKPKRKFWQIHLSTLVALTLIGGAVLWSNIRQNNFKEEQQIDQEGRAELEHEARMAISAGASVGNKCFSRHSMAGQKRHTQAKVK